MNLMNINALIALCFLSSCMAAWLVYTGQKVGRMGLAAIPLLVLPFAKMFGRFMPKVWPLSGKAYEVACEAR